MVSVSSSSPATSVITSAYSMERWDDLLEAVASARGFRPPADEIIIVIDHNPSLKARVRLELNAPD